MAKDPVCGMKVDEKKAAAKTVHQGKEVYFCSDHCKEKFLKEPARYVVKKGGGC